MNVAYPGVPGFDAKIAALVAHQDACFFSYYENGNDFGGPKSQGVTTDVGAMVSSCDDQVTFVSDVFATWDAHAARVVAEAKARGF